MIINNKNDQIEIYHFQVIKLCQLWNHNSNLEVFHKYIISKSFPPIVETFNVYLNLPRLSTPGPGSNIQ